MQRNKNETSYGIEATMLVLSNTFCFFFFALFCISRKQRRKTTCGWNRNWKNKWNANEKVRQKQLNKTCVMWHLPTDHNGEKKSYEEIVMSEAERLNYDFVMRWSSSSSFTSKRNVHKVIFNSFCFALSNMFFCLLFFFYDSKHTRDDNATTQS